MYELKYFSSSSNGSGISINEFKKNKKVTVKINLTFISYITDLLEYWEEAWIRVSF